MTPEERKLIERLCDAVEDLATAVSDHGHLTGLDEVWGSLGHVSTSIDELTEELKQQRGRMTP